MSRNEIYDPYQQDMYYNRKQYYQNPHPYERSYDSRDEYGLQDEDLRSQQKSSKNPLLSLQDYFGRNRENHSTNEKQSHSHLDENNQGNEELHISTLKDPEELEEEMLLHFFLMNTHSFELGMQLK